MTRLLDETDGLGLALRKDLILNGDLSTRTDLLAALGLDARSSAAGAFGLTARTSAGQVGLSANPSARAAVLALAESLPPRGALAAAVGHLGDGFLATDVARARSVAIRQLIATSGIAELLGSDKMLSAWRQSLLSEATARSLIGTTALDGNTSHLLREVVGVNTATARIVSRFAEQNRSAILAPASSGRPTRRLRNYLEHLPLEPSSRDLTVAALASRGVAGIAAADILNSPGDVDTDSGDLFSAEVVEPWLTGHQKSRDRLLKRLAQLDPAIAELLVGAWEDIERNGPAAVSKASHCAAEVLDRTLRAISPNDASLDWHAAEGRPDAELHNARPTRRLRIAFALHQRPGIEAKVVAAQTEALAATTASLQTKLQAGKHASAGELELVRGYLVALEAMLTQLLSD